MSSICTSGASLANSSRAAFRIRARLRRASARIGRTGSRRSLMDAPNFYLTDGIVAPYHARCKRKRSSPSMTEMTPRAKNLALLLLAMTQFVIVIDASIVNIALPSIGRALSFSRTDLSWVVNAYTLTFGGFLLLGGRLADLLGRRRMFMLGLVLFSVAPFPGGIAQSEGWL